MEFLEELRWRGLVQQTTDDEGMEAWLSERPRSVYVGFDPTAESLHVGSLMPLLLLRRFQKAGHKPIAVVGGATGMIGDPSGKSAERNLLSGEALEKNVAGLRGQIGRFLDFDAESQRAELVNNVDWIGGFSYIEFLRDVGKNFPINVMLAKDSVKSRIGRDDAGMSYTEFSYMLLQAYDFVHLHHQFGCELQAGGSDQWGNITAGIDLARRMRGVHLHGMTSPLLTKSDGSKMGKTESGAIWLSAERTSPYEFFQYWRNTDDADVSRCLRMLTELLPEQIEEIERTHSAAPHERIGQVRLAEELTTLVHGEAELEKVRKASSVLFGAEISDLDDQQLGQIFADVPSKEVSRSILSGPGMPIVDALIESGLAKSKSDARRTIEQGGAYVNNRRVDTADKVLATGDLASESVLVLRSGRKRYALLRFV